MGFRDTGETEELRKLQTLAARPAVCFVDCGFVRRQIARIIGEEESRDVKINTEYLTREMANISHLRLLRSYLYDAAYPPEHQNYQAQQADHARMADSASVQLRLGSLRGKKLRQKGVDTRIVLDMLTMAQHGAYDTAVLWTGDGDFTEVVDQVQRPGRQVALVTPTGGPAANDLRQTCDIVLEMEDVWWRRLHHRGA